MSAVLGAVLDFRLDWRSGIQRGADAGRGFRIGLLVMQQLRRGLASRLLQRVTAARLKGLVAPSDVALAVRYDEENSRTQCRVSQPFQQAFVPVLGRHVLECEDKGWLALVFSLFPADRCYPEPSRIVLDGPRKDFRNGLSILTNRFHNLPRERRNIGRKGIFQPLAKPVLFAQAEPLSSSAHTGEEQAAVFRDLENDVGNGIGAAIRLRVLLRQ